MMKHGTRSKSPPSWLQRKTTPRLWTARKNLVYPTAYDLAPDGKRFAITEPVAATEEKTGTHITFLLNFFDELRRRVPPGK